MRLKAPTIVLAVVVMLVAAPLRSVAATCFCKVTANGTEVAKPSKGGYVQGVQKGACKNYCRGIWDGKTSAELSEWAKLLGRCGEIALNMDAAIGTAGYEGVRNTTVKIQCAPSPPPSCNLIRNGDFATGLNVVGNGSMPTSTVANWSAPFGTPQITANAGCGGSLGFMSMWGNKTVGEAIQHVLSTPLVPGKTYKLSACVRWVSKPALPQYVRFRVRLSNGPPNLYTSSTPLMGIIGHPTNIPPSSLGITSQQWTTVTLADLHPPANTNLQTITINPENDNTADDGGTVSWGQIDNICLQDMSAPCLAPNPDFTLTAVLSAGNATTYQLTATNTPLPPGTGFSWQVEELDPTTGNVLPTTTVVNPAPWWTNPTTNAFSGYNGTASLGNTGNPGVFKQGHKYRITRGVWDACHPWTSISHTVLMSTP